MTKDELQQLSTEELKARLAEKEDEQSQCNIMQMGLKITLNSAYGMLGNEFSRYFDTRVAEAITVSGQLSIRWIERVLNSGLNQMMGTTDTNFIVAGDTDSVYITLKPIVDAVGRGKTTDELVAFIDRVAKEKLEPMIDAGYEELAEYMNAFAQRMFMKRELIASRGVWRAKKNYALLVHNSEGVAYDVPKVKIKGMESTRSSTPKICRDAFVDTVRKALSEDERAVQEYISTFRKEYLGGKLEKISFPRGISDIGKYMTDLDYKESYTGMSVSDLAVFKGSTPAHVSGALLYNRLLKFYGLEKIHKPLRNGDKLKYCYLTKDNPTGHHVLSFEDEIPPEFGLDNYVNRVAQYEKAFLSPITSVITLFGWSVERRNNLMELFG